MRSKVAVIISVSILVVAIVTGGVYLQRKKYEYLSPKKGKIIEAIYAQGKVKTDQVYELKLGHTSIVDQYYVKEGDKIEKDDKLLQLSTGLSFKSPIAGIISSVNFHKNETVPANTAIVKVENVDTLYLEVSLEQKGALRVTPGLQAKIIFESLRGESYLGKVKSIYTRNDQFIAKIDVNNLKKIFYLE